MILTNYHTTRGLPLSVCLLLKTLKLCLYVAIEIYRHNNVYVKVAYDNFDNNDVTAVMSLQLLVYVQSYYYSISVSDKKAFYGVSLKCDGTVQDRHV